MSGRIKLLIVMLAIALVLPALVKNRRDAAAEAVQLGQAALLTGEWDDARRHFDEAIRLDPEYCGGWEGRAYVNGAKREWNVALADLDRAIELDPENATLFDMRGMVWMNMRDYPKAIADQSRAIQLNPEQSTYYSNRAIIHFLMG